MRKNRKTKYNEKFVVFIHAAIWFPKPLKYLFWKLRHFL